jgi:hypothetical protein
MEQQSQMQSSSFQSAPAHISTIAALCSPRLYIQDEPGECSVDLQKTMKELPAT